MTHCCYEVNQCSEVSPISPFWLKNLHDIHVLARSGPMEIAIFHGFVQAKLTQQLNAKLGRCCFDSTRAMRWVSGGPGKIVQSKCYGSDLLLPFLQNAGPNGVRWTAILAQVKYRLLRQEMILNKF